MVDVGEVEHEVHESAAVRPAQRVRRIPMPVTTMAIRLAPGWRGGAPSQWVAMGWGWAANAPALHGLGGLRRHVAQARLGQHYRPAQQRLRRAQQLRVPQEAIKPRRGEQRLAVPALAAGAPVSRQAIAAARAQRWGWAHRVW